MADPTSRQVVQQLHACVAALQQLGDFDWLEKHDSCPKVSPALCEHSVYVSALLHDATRVSFDTATIKALTRSQRAAQQPDASADMPMQSVPVPASVLDMTQPDAEPLAPADIPVEVPAQSELYESPAQQTSLLKRLRAGYVHDSSLGDPQQPAKLHQHMHPWEDLWLHAPDNSIVVPDHESLRNDIIAELHDSLYAGHPGGNRTISLVKRDLWWEGLSRDCRAFVKGCTLCQRNKTSTQKPAGELRSHAMPGGKWQDVSMDFITDLPLTARGDNMILVVVDTFTKMTHLIPCHKMLNARGTASLLWQHVFCKLGVPVKLISD